MDASPETFFVANDKTLVPLIETASRRLIVVAPAVTTAVAEAISLKWRELGPDRVSVVLDVSEEPYQIGYGDPEGLRLLEETAKSVGGAIRQQKGVRIGLLVADDATLVYSPTPLSVEKAPGQDNDSIEDAPPRPDEGDSSDDSQHEAEERKEEEAPNAILLGPPPAGLEKQVQGDGATLGARPADIFTLRNVKRLLEQNPPRKFEITRTERVFNAKLEFVEFELVGAALSRRKAPIPQHLLSLPGGDNAKNILEAHFRLVEKDGPLNHKKLSDEKRALAEEFLFSIPRFGNVILRRSKKAFSEGVQALQQKVEEFRKDAKEKLGEEIARNRALIVNALIPNLVESPPKEWHKYGIWKGADEGQIRKRLENELSDAYGNPSEILDKVKLNVIFKGVTYQTLQDPEFAEHAKELLQMESIYEEYEAAPIRQDLQDQDDDS